jgi:hypothetical protein
MTSGTDNNPESQGAAHDLFQKLKMTFWLRQLEAVARGR